MKSPLLSICIFLLCSLSLVGTHAQTDSASILVNYLSLVSKLDSVVDSKDQLIQSELVYPVIKSFVALSILGLDSINPTKIQKPDSICEMKRKSVEILNPNAIMIPRNQLEFDLLNDEYDDSDKVSFFFQPLLKMIPCGPPDSLDNLKFFSETEHSAYQPLIRTSYVFYFGHPLYDWRFLNDRHMYFYFWLHKDLLKDIGDTLDYSDTRVSVDISRVDTIRGKEFAATIGVGHGEFFPKKRTISIPLTPADDSLSSEEYDKEFYSTFGFEIWSPLIPNRSLNRGVDVTQIQVHLYRQEGNEICADKIASFEATYLR